MLAFLWYMRRQAFPVGSTSSGRAEKEKTAIQTIHETVRTSLHAVGVLIAALALLGTAGYFAISSVVAEETRELRDQVSAMQHHIAQIPKIVDRIEALQQQSRKQNEVNDEVLETLNKLLTKE